MFNSVRLCSMGLVEDKGIGFRTVFYEACVLRDCSMRLVEDKGFGLGAERLCSMRRVED